MSMRIPEIVEWVEDDPFEVITSQTSLVGIEAFAAAQGLCLQRAQIVVDAAGRGLRERLNDLTDEKRLLEDRLGKTTFEIELIEEALDPTKGREAVQRHTALRDLPPEAEQVVRLVEYKGTPSKEEVEGIFRNLGGFRIDFVQDELGMDIGLSGWFKQMKLQGNTLEGLGRGNLTRSLERVIKRFSKQLHNRFDEGNGFKFVKELSEMPNSFVDIEVVELGGRELISALVVNDPVLFLTESLSNATYKPRLKGAGLSALLALRLIALIQERDNSSK